MTDFIHEPPKNEQPAAPAPEKPKTERERQKRVYTYILILFTAAFLLILWSFLMTHRSNQQVISELKGNTSLLEVTLQEKEALEDEVEALTDENSALTRENEQLRQSLERAQSEYTKTLDMSMLSMDLFWQIDEAYVLRDYDSCRELIAAFEAASLMPYLSQERVSSYRDISACDRYAEICEALNVTYGNGWKP